MVFCNTEKYKSKTFCICVTILILVDGFLQYQGITYIGNNEFVTILILVDGFLQSRDLSMSEDIKYSHNPYFSRWFSAIDTEKL